MRSCPEEVQGGPNGSGYFRRSACGRVYVLYARAGTVGVEVMRGVTPEEAANALRKTADWLEANGFAADPPWGARRAD
jgi:hypothetical protein